MKILNYLNEASVGGKLVICDIQPEYGRHLPYKMPQFTNWLNRSKFDDILVLYNGNYTGQTPDKKEDVEEFYFDNGLSEDTHRNMTFIDKGYGFLRRWMDRNIQERIILEVLNYMEKFDMKSSDEIDPEYLKVRWPRLKYEIDSISYPENLEKQEAKPYSGSTIVGGGKKECLAELKILFKHWNIKTSEYPRYVY